MKPMEGGKRARVPTDAAPRAPTYEELEAEVKRLRQRVQELELRPGVVEPPQPGVTLTKEELQGERRRKLFLTSDIYREHIAPKLGKTWRAILLEACGQAVSRPLGETKTMSTRDVVRSVPMLIWCIERGYKLTMRTAMNAAEQGNLDVIKYLHENGCPWDEETCWRAAQAGHLDVLKYAHENACPWNWLTCTKAAAGDHLHVLKYAHEHGCPWNRAQCLQYAIHNRHHHVIAWIDAQPQQIMN